MTELLTAAQMRAIEHAAIESGEVTGLELMERAGRGVVEAIFEEWPDLDVGEEGGAAPRPADSPRSISTKKKAVVLCGPGNNGGDGFVVARLLSERGWAVEVFLYGDAEKLPPDARVNYERWRELGDVGEWGAYSKRKTWACDLLIDALFGTGLARGLPELGELFWNMEDMVGSFQVSIGHQTGRPAIVAIDLPSGICADSGREFDAVEDCWRNAATAHLSVTFHSHKLGHFLGVGPKKSGTVVCKSIGIEKCSKVASKRSGPSSKLVQPIHPSWIKKDKLDHKFSHGHALILSGGPGHTGAARLAARGALRIGAGLVTLGVPPAAQQEVAAQVTAVMLKRIGDRQALAERLKDARINALCLGPALGLDETAAECVAEALAAKRATVLDADALTLISREKSLFEALHNGCVLTPHAGEFARLFPDIADKLNAVPTKGPAYSKVDATREAAKRAGCVVLFKGADTVIAAPDGRCAINSAQYERAAPWLATAGSGDVLAGFITGLMARGFDPMQAAEIGAWLHVECALTFGPGLIAEDLPEQLPAVFRDLGL